jgi:hypothetical protein
MKILASLLASAALLLTVGTASADPTNSARDCGGTGLNPGQAFQLPNLAGGPAAGPEQAQTPPEFADLLGADSVGELLKRDCVKDKTPPGQN